MTSLARAMMSMLLVMRIAGGGEDSDPPGAELPAGDVHPGQLPWDRLDTVAVLGGGPMWDEPPFYRVFDAVLDNEGDAVFLVNGGDGELIRYDIGSGRTSRIGRRGSGPGEFGRPVWLEPHGPDSLLAYDMSLGRFSVFSRSGHFGRIFMLPGDGGRGRHVAAVTRMGARVWAALSLGTPPGTKARDTVAVLEVTPEGGVSNTVARDPHGQWERGPDTRSFQLIRDDYAAWATIAGGGGRLVRGDLRRGFAGGVRLPCRRRYGRIVPISGRADGVAAPRPARDAREPRGIVVDR